MTNDDLRKAIEEKKAAKAAPAAKAAEEHERGYLQAYLAALDTCDPDELVTVDVPRVGKCLLGFAARPDHALFTKSINEKVEVSPCLTFAVKCARWPAPPEFKRLLEERNPEGFVTCALAVKSAMAGKVIEEGKE
jgi:hypothetical protein